MSAYPVDIIMSIAKHENVNIESIFVNIPFQNRKDIPDCRGVYILKDTFNNRYIGKSNNIRVRQDFNRMKNIVTIDVFSIEDVAYTNIFESVLIRQLEPELNKVGNPAYYRKFGNKKWQ